MFKSSTALSRDRGSKPAQGLPANLDPRSVSSHLRSGLSVHLTDTLPLAGKPAARCFAEPRSDSRDHFLFLNFFFGCWLVWKTR